MGYFDALVVPTLRAFLGQVLITPCQISRNTPVPDGMGGQTNAWATISPPALTCRVASAPMLVEERDIEGRLSSVVRWTIHLPAGTDVTAKDRIVALGVTYEVSAPMAPRTFEALRRVQCVVIA